jgi:hypothetical protein
MGSVGYLICGAARAVADAKIAPHGGISLAVRHQRAARRAQLNGDGAFEDFDGGAADAWD